MSLADTVTITGGAAEELPDLIQTCGTASYIFLNKKKDSISGNWTAGENSCIIYAPWILWIDGIVQK